MVTTVGEQDLCTMMERRYDGEAWHDFTCDDTVDELFHDWSKNGRSLRIGIPTLYYHVIHQ